MKKFLTYLIIAASCLIVMSCNKKDDPVPDKNVKRTILVYAVAANNLSSYLNMNMNAMLVGMTSVNTDDYRLLVCRTQYDSSKGSPTPQELMEAEITPSGPVWKTIKTYDSDKRSVDSERIAQVISDVQEMYPSDSYGLIFWSHSDAWNPSSNYTVPQKSFGQEKDGGKSYYCEITDLAKAVPYNFADFIWFDSCYMANIESAYEFHDKCKWFVGSVIELDSDGMPYNLTLPVLLSDNGSVIDAAEVTYNFIENKNIPVSMSVFDMSKIERVADAAAKATANFTPLPYGASLQHYSRMISPVLYDFGDYVSTLAAQNGTDDSDLKEAMKEFVVYKALTSYGWGRMSFDIDLFSGASCHNYQDSKDKGDSFYRTLAWYKRVFPHND